MNFFFEPAPAKDVAAFIRGKAPLTRTQFDQLLPELRALSFTVSGISAANALQDLRDTIATLPEGALFKDVQKALAQKLGDHVEHPPDLFEETAEEKEARMEKLENQARFILRQNGNQAYSAVAHRDLAENKDLFPYWKYLTVGDDHVRASHAALEGVTLPADDPFWHHHYPPWEYNCRCQVVPVTRREYELLQDEDKDKPIEERSTLDEKQKELLDTERALYRNIAGVPTKIDLRAPIEKPHEGHDVYVFDPRQFQIPLDSLKDRYDPEVWDGFVKFAKNTDVEGAGNLWKWLNKSVTPRGGATRPAPKPDPFHDDVLVSVSNEPAFRKFMPVAVKSDLRHLANAPEGASVRVTPHGKETWLVQWDDPDIGVAQRIISGNAQAGFSCYNALFVLYDTGTGHGARALYRQATTAQRLGIRELTCQAARGDDEYVGYFVWPKLGYDGAIPHHLREDIEAEFGTHYESVQEFLQGEGGPALQWWKENGEDFHAHFDLTEGSLSMEILRKYMHKKGHLS